MLGRAVSVLGLLALSTSVGPVLQPAPQAPVASTGSIARSPRNANYTIAARLDPASRTLTGNQRLSWRNISNVPAATLRFHLYYNAWRNTKSTWMRERLLANPGAGNRPDPRPAAW